jgi:hypothetical protein
MFIDSQLVPHLVEIGVYGTPNSVPLRVLRSFWHVHIVWKRAKQLRHVRPSACISAAPTGRISVEFDIEEFNENLSRNFKFG